MMPAAASAPHQQPAPRQHVLTRTARRAGSILWHRIRLGAARIRANGSQILQIIVGATVAYEFCRLVLGHEYPFLAAVAATVGTGVTTDKRLRRATEIGLGATLGVLVGELVLHAFGAGPWQMAVVLAVGLLIGNFANSGAIFVTQVAIQSLYVITVPLSLAAQPFDRTLDALVGALTAILLALIVPSDARKRPRDRASTLLFEISELLSMTATALRDADRELAEQTLDRARDSQALIDSWRTSLNVSREATRINARSRRYAAEVNRLARACEYADRAIRSERVALRRVISVTDSGKPRTELAELVEGLSRGAAMLRIALMRGTSRVPSQDFLLDVSSRLDVKADFVTDVYDESLILLLRPLAADLIAATGMSEAGASSALPQLPEPS